MRIKSLAPSSSPHRESGAVAVLFAILSLLLVICLAFAIDLGYAWQVKRSMVKATDAAALSAAQEARNAAVAGRPLSSGLCSNTSAEITNEARQRLTDNRAASNLEFCVIGSTPTKDKGVVTVRGNYDAKLSFAGVIGKNEITVSSSSSAKWEKAKLLPIGVCEGAQGGEIFKWIEDVSRTPLETQKLEVSSSDRSAFCSGGKSGGFAVIDLEPRADGRFPPDDDKKGVTDYCTRTTDQIRTTFLAGLTGTGNFRPIKKDDLRCARTGQYLGTEVDRALCAAATGTQFVLPIVEKGDTTRATGSNNNYIVEISGFALASFDRYRGKNDTDICSGIAVGPSRKRNLSKAQLVAARHQVRKQQRTKLRKAAACNSGDLSITGTNWPTEIQLPKSTATGISTSIALTCTENGSRDVASGVVINVYPGTTGLTSSALTSIDTGCSATGSNPIAITCTALTISRGTPRLINFSVTPPSAGTIQISARVTSGLGGDLCTNSVYPVNVDCIAHVSRASLLVKPPLPTPNFKISAAWPATSLSGNKILLTTNVALSNYATNGKIKLELRIAPGTTGLTDASILNAKLTGLPQTACTVNASSVANGVIVKTCTVDVLAGENGFEVTWEISPPLAGTLNVSACATPVDPTTDNNAADNGWPSTTGCSVTNTHPIVITQPVVIDDGEFREMTFSFISYYNKGSSSDITSYQICSIGIKTISDATSLGISRGC